jgi:hypothetical protein
MVFTTKMVDSSKSWVFGSQKSKETLREDFPLVTQIDVDPKRKESRSNSAGIPMVKVTIYGLNYQVIEACFQEGLRKIQESLAYDQEKKEKTARWHRQQLSNRHYDAEDALLAKHEGPAILAEDNALEQGLKMGLREKKKQTQTHLPIATPIKYSGSKNSFGALFVDSDEEDDEEQSMAQANRNIRKGKPTPEEITEMTFDEDFPEFGTKELPKVASWPIQQQTIPASVDWGSPEMEDDW